MVSTHGGLRNSSPWTMHSRSSVRPSGHVEVTLQSDDAFFLASPKAASASLRGESKQSQDERGAREERTQAWSVSGGRRGTYAQIARRRAAMAWMPRLSGLLAAAAGGGAKPRGGPRAVTRRLCAKEGLKFNEVRLPP